MKRLASMLIAGLLPLFAIAQTDAADAADPVRYDSLSNYLGGAIYQYIGQRLYVKPRCETLQEYGYEYFYNSMSVKDVYKRISSASYNSKYHELAGKTFSVIGVEKRPLEKNEKPLWIAELDNGCAYFLKLTDGTDTLFFKYPANEASFPFVVAGYHEKLKRQIGRRYYLKKWADDATADYVTGATVRLYPGTLWTVADVVVDRKYDYGLLFVFKNGRGERISCEANCVRSDFIEKRQGDRLQGKYGATLFRAVLQRKIRQGMTRELVRAAWGEPEGVYPTDGGERWMYGNQFLHFRGDVMTACD